MSVQKAESVGSQGGRQGQSTPWTFTRGFHVRQEAGDAVYDEMDKMQSGIRGTAPEESHRH